MRRVPSVVWNDPVVQEWAKVIGEPGKSPGWVVRDAGPIFEGTFDPDRSSGPFHFPEPFDPAKRQGMLDELLRKGYEKRGDKVYKSGEVTPDKAEESDDRQARSDFLSDFIDSMGQDQADLSSVFDTALNLGRGDRQDLSRRGAEGIFRPRGIG
jgi:hypothetical protein